MVLRTRVCACGVFFDTRSANGRKCDDCMDRSRRVPINAHGRDFIMVDGEGVTDDDGHRYVLFSVGTESLTRDGDTLTMHDIFPFLWEQYELNPDAVFGGFYLSYDFSQWFNVLPEERARMLFTERGKQARKPKLGNRVEPFPVQYAGYEFDMLGMRRLKLRPEGSKKWLYVNDTGPFWQTSLMNVINPKSWPEPICTDAEYAVVKAGKAVRASAQLDADMIRYNVTENEIASRAMHRLERGFAAVGVNLRKSAFYGPGQAAQQWFNNIKAPTGEQVRAVTPNPVLFAAQATFYGGWFEIPTHGHLPGVTHEYDINSAYPYALAMLPCLLHGTWVRDTRPAQWSLVYASTVGSNPYLGGLPHRTAQGMISRPHMNEGWFWRHELHAASAAGLIDTFDIHDAWRYEPCHCLPPVRAIRDLYQHRLDVGKNTPEGKADKLIVNSCYGKTAQSIGAPKYANPIYASLITSLCRTWILDAIATHPHGARAVRMIATDGIYFDTPHHTLNLSKTELGAWDHTERTDMCLFLPGIYWDADTRTALRDGTDVKIKSRGINARDLAEHIDHVDQLFTYDYLWPSIEIPVTFSVVSPALALARNKWDTCGLVQTYERHGITKTLSADPTTKRQPHAINDNGLVRTNVYTDRGPNHPYTRSFGMDLTTILNNDILLTPDGTINTELYEMLKG